MEDFVIVAILLLILGGAAWYVYKAKKSGKKCIGCPDGCCSCQSGEGCGCGCSGNTGAE